MLIIHSDSTGAVDCASKNFRRLVNDGRFEDVPALLETPDLANGERGYAENLGTLRGFRSD